MSTISRADVPVNVLRCLFEEPFMRNVFSGDPSLSLPDYTSVISNPMWVGRILEKLDQQQYTDLKQLYSDIHLIFDNAIKFNAPLPGWANEARFLKFFFMSHLENISPLLRSVPDIELVPFSANHDAHSLIKIFDNVETLPGASTFAKPVPKSNVLYHQRISHPMSFDVIKKKLKGGQYPKVLDFVFDMRQIAFNCIWFNGPINALSRNVQEIMKHFFDLLFQARGGTWCPELFFTAVAASPHSATAPVVQNVKSSGSDVPDAKPAGAPLVLKLARPASTVGVSSPSVVDPLAQSISLTPQPHFAEPTKVPSLVIRLPSMTPTMNVSNTTPMQVAASPLPLKAAATPTMISARPVDPSKCGMASSQLYDSELRRVLLESFRQSDPHSLISAAAEFAINHKPNTATLWAYHQARNVINGIADDQERIGRSDIGSEAINCDSSATWLFSPVASSVLAHPPGGLNAWIPRSRKLDRLDSVVKIKHVSSLQLLQDLRLFLAPALCMPRHMPHSRLAVRLSFELESTVHRSLCLQVLEALEERYVEYFSMFKDNIVVSSKFVPTEDQLKISTIPADARQAPPSLFMLPADVHDSVDVEIIGFDAIQLFQKRTPDSNCMARHVRKLLRSVINRSSSESEGSSEFRAQSARARVLLAEFDLLFDEQIVASAPSVPVLNASCQKNMVFLDRIFSKTNAADFFAFLTPIDAPRHDMIDYFECCPRPIDLGTIRRRCALGHYVDMQSFREDVFRTFSNCVNYHKDRAATQHLVKMGELASSKAELLWDQSMETAASSVGPDSLDAASNGNVSSHIPPVSIPGLEEEGKAESAVSTFSSERGVKAASEFLDWLKQLIQRPTFADFVHDVDVQFFPRYSEFVKTPMCLLQIWNNVCGGKYKSSADFKLDVELVYSNCVAFNSVNVKIAIVACALNEEIIMFVDQNSAFFEVALESFQDEAVRLAFVGVSPLTQLQVQRYEATQRLHTPKAFVSPKPVVVKSKPVSIPSAVASHQAPLNPGPAASHSSSVAALSGLSIAHDNTVLQSNVAFSAPITASTRSSHVARCFSESSVADASEEFMVNFPVSKRRRVMPAPAASVDSVEPAKWLSIDAPNSTISGNQPRDRPRIAFSFKK